MSLMNKKGFSGYKHFKFNDVLSQRTLAKQRMSSCTFSLMDLVQGMEQQPTYALLMSLTESIVALFWKRHDWPPCMRSLFQG